MIQDGVLPDVNVWTYTSSTNSMAINVYTSVPLDGWIIPLSLIMRIDTTMRCTSVRNVRERVTKVLSILQ